jgi:hypothetical protein
VRSSCWELVFYSSEAFSDGSPIEDTFTACFGRLAEYVVRFDRRIDRCG